MSAFPTGSAVSSPCIFRDEAVHDSDKAMTRTILLNSDSPEITGGGGVPASNGRFFATFEGRRLCFQPQADPASLGKIIIYDTTADPTKWVAIGALEPRLFK